MGGIKNKPAQQPPFKPIHKAVMAGQSPWPDLKKNDKKFQKNHQLRKLFQKKTPQHVINKTAVIVGVLGVVALFFIAMR